MRAFQKAIIKGISRAESSLIFDSTRYLANNTPITVSIIPLKDLFEFIINDLFNWQYFLLPIFILRFDVLIAIIATQKPLQNR